jgi:hypothetical protein
MMPRPRAVGGRLQDQTSFSWLGPARRTFDIKAGRVNIQAGGCRADQPAVRRRYVATTMMDSVAGSMGFVPNVPAGEYSPPGRQGEGWRDVLRHLRSRCCNGGRESTAPPTRPASAPHPLPSSQCRTPTPVPSDRISSSPPPFEPYRTAIIGGCSFSL